MSVFHVNESVIFSINPFLFWNSFIPLSFIFWKLFNLTCHFLLMNCFSVPNSQTESNSKTGYVCLFTRSISSSNFSFLDFASSTEICWLMEGKEWNSLLLTPRPQGSTRRITLRQQELGVVDIQIFLLPWSKRKR